MKLLLMFTAVKEDGTQMPMAIDGNEVLSIYYGNYGTEHDRCFWPGLHVASIGHTERPLMVIKLKGNNSLGIDKIAVSDSIKFLHTL